MAKHTKKKAKANRKKGNLVIKISIGHKKKKDDNDKDDMKKKKRK